MSNALLAVKHLDAYGQTSWKLYEYMSWYFYNIWKEAGWMKTAVFSMVRMRLLRWRGEESIMPTVYAGGN